MDHDGSLGQSQGASVETLEGSETLVGFMVAVFFPEGRRPVHLANISLPWPFHKPHPQLSLSPANPKTLNPKP